MQLMYAPISTLNRKVAVLAVGNDVWNLTKVLYPRINYRASIGGFVTFFHVKKRFKNFTESWGSFRTLTNVRTNHLRNLKGRHWRHGGSRWEVKGRRMISDKEDAESSVNFPRNWLLAIYEISIHLIVVQLSIYWSECYTRKLNYLNWLHTCIFLGDLELLWSSILFVTIMEWEAIFVLWVQTLANLVSVWD